MSDLAAQLAARHSEIVETLRTCIEPADTYPAALHDAMHYAVFAGGKRLRPILALLTTELVAGGVAPVHRAACAVELIHTASLILDDLPCMDDATLRRGQPPVHLKFDEATAILAADALLMRAFRCVSESAAAVGASAAGTQAAVTEVAEAVGALGMIGGQHVDLHLPEQPDFKTLEYVHSHKTGALFIAAAVIGPQLVDAPANAIDALRAYAKNLGLAFQITDDILGATATPEHLGKAAHADADRRTFVHIMGVAEAQHIVNDLIDSARAALRPFGEPAAVLHAFAEHLRVRDR